MRPLERLSRSSFALIAALLPWASFLPGLRAQEDGALEPAKELEKLERLLGDWKGSGIARMSAGGPDLPWTGAGSVQRILDGFAIQEDLRVDPGPGVPPLLFRTVYGWDPHREQYRWFGISNMGFGGVGDAHLTSDGKLLVTREHMEDGVPVVDTTTTWIEEGKYRFRILRSRAGAPFFAHVEATFEKSGDSIDVAKVKDAEVLPPPAEIRAAGRQVGEWRFEGKLSPVPGAPTVSVSGQEEIRAILGGHVYFGISVGDPIPGAPRRFQGNFYTVWDPAERAFRVLGVDNFGSIENSTGHMVTERSMVVGGHGSMFGAPFTTRMVLEWNEAGDRIETRIDRCFGESPCDVAFEAIYERVGDKKPRAGESRREEKKDGETKKRPAE